MTSVDRDLPPDLARLWHAVDGGLWLARRLEVEEDDRVGLDELDHAVSDRVSAWCASEARWEIIRWPVTDKPAASLRVERADAEAELILWISGEAELIYARSIGDEPVSEHYEITTELGLNGCLDDLEAYIGLREPPVVAGL